MAALLPTGPVLAAGANVVISEVYGGGGNLNATLANDFVELHNRTGSSVDLTGWSVQYASAAGTTWQVKSLTGSIGAHGYLLVGMASGGSYGSPLPTPDAASTIAMSSTAGKVALLNTTTACSGTCVGGGQVVDFVGYGTANASEGTGAAPALSAILSAQRLDAGQQDTDENSEDLFAGTPDPKNSASPPSETDTDAPTDVAIGKLATFQAALSTKVRWSATDGGSGVAAYTVRFRRAVLAGDWSSGTWLTDTAATDDTWTGVQGMNVCFRVEARDGSGNTSEPSAERCTALPIDDAALTRSRFSRQLSKGSLGGFVVKATAKGATLISPTTTGRRFALIVNRCPTCGTVKVVWEDLVLGRVSLAAKKLQKRVIVPLPVLPAAETGTLRIIVTSAGKPVLIDGIVAGRD